jgi:hypothetical protein
LARSLDREGLVGSLSTGGTTVKRALAIVAGFTGVLVTDGTLLMAQHEGCDRQRLGSAVVADTSAMQRVEVRSLPQRSSEGAEATAYYDGWDLRVIVLVEYGEMGRSVTRFFVLDSLNFVVEREVKVFDRPMYESAPRVISAVRDYVYYCQGRALTSVPAIAEEGKALLDSLLQRLRQQR